GENGKFTLIVKFIGTTNMADAEVPVEVTITRNPLTADMVTLSAESATYNGTEQKPIVTVTGLMVGTDYDVTFQDGFKNAGTYTVTVTGKGIYEGTVKKTFTIGKATPTIAWANNVVTLTYTGQPADIKPVVTLVNGETFSGTITYHHTNTDSSESGESKAGLPTNAGIYVVGARIPEQDNYTAAATAFLMLTINKADQTVPAAPTAAEDNIKDNSITLDAIENAEYKRDDGEWQESPTFTGLEPNQAYTFYARLKKDDNHNASPSSAGTSITTRKAMLENASVTITGTYTYTGAAIVPEAGNVEVVLNGTKIDSDQYTISASNNINAGVGKATLTVTATETGNYSGSVSSSFTIKQAALTVTANDQSITYGGSIATSTDQVTPAGLVGGDTLESVTLTPSSNQVAVADKTITPSAAVIKRGGEDATANYNITYQPGALTINKSQPTINWAEGFGLDKTYDGQTIPNPTAEQLTITGASYGNVTFTWYKGSVAEANKLNAAPKDAGTYILTASIPETTNTAAASTDPLTVTISKAPLTVTGVTIKTRPYKPTNHAVEVSGVSFTGLVNGETLTLDQDYAAFGNYDDPNAGTNKPATIRVELNSSAKANNYNLTNSSVSATGDVTKASQTAPSITGLPTGTITYGDAFTLHTDSGVNWSASGAAAVDSSGKVTVTGVGKAAITATKPGSGNYEAAENRITFTAVPKALAVTGLTVTDRAYDGTSTVEITGVTLSGIVTGDTVSVNTTGLTGTLNGSNAGTYTAVTLPRLTLTGGAASNYTLTQPAGAVPASVTIEKAPALPTKPGDLAVANKQEHTYTYGLGALRPDVPEGMSLGSSAVTYTLGTVSLGGYYDSAKDGAKIEGQTLTLPIEAVQNDKAEEIGTVTVIIHTQNFEDMTATIDVRSVNKIIPTGGPNLSGNTLTYGQALSAITLSGNMKDGETPVPGKFEWSNPDNRPAVQENYAAAWIFKPDDNKTYAIVTGTALIQVLPAPITGVVIVLDHTAFKYDGQPHRPGITSVTLNGTPLTADVDYTAAIPEGTEAGTYTVTLTGKGNYTGTATAVFQINPVEQKPLDQKDDDGHDLRLEVETGLSTVPEALKNNEEYDTPAKIESALRTRVAEVLSNVGEQIAVFDVTLQYRDSSGTWHNVDPDNFPANGVTAVLPYPAGTGATGYTFTVQHLISSGAQAGTMETLPYELTADGLRCKFSSLSPVAIGYQTATKPNPQPNPGGNSGGGSGGGGWSSSTYAITVEKSEHGKVTSNRTNASNGSTVTLTVTPDSGYVLDALTVTDSRGNEIKLTAQGGNKYTFTMPSRAVTVKASFVPLPDDTQKPCDGGADCPSHGFTDLGSVGTWYHEAVDYVLRNGLMNGYSNGTFGPNDNLSRAQF
ncbi:YDG domain-containing protein, partial [uncultured Oscillibacter sp.]|uniref:YDG domain-containing protein n=1 Tax=uncultured Oscillibacter sp. TaxID=876091 RepID=UPI0025F1A2D0